VEVANRHMHLEARGCPGPVAGRSRMPSWHPLTRCCSRFAGHRSAAGGLVVATLDQQRRLPGHRAAPRYVRARPRLDRPWGRAGQLSP